MSRRRLLELIIGLIVAGTVLTIQFLWPVHGLGGGCCDRPSVMQYGWPLVWHTVTTGGLLPGSTNVIDYPHLIIDAVVLIIAIGIVIELMSLRRRK